MPVGLIQHDPFKDFPDLKGIETVRSTPSYKYADQFKDFPDLKGIETSLNCALRISWILFKDFPDLKGIETPDDGGDERRGLW